MADSSPTVRQRELGLRLRKIRTGLGLTVEDVAEKLMCSAAKISRLETGARRPVLRDIRDLCTLYALDAKATSELMELTKQARMRAWWDEYDDLDLVPYIGLEQEASAITAYGLLWLPGLLQTEDYARAIIKAIAPHIDQEVQEERVRARMRRQQLLAGGNPPRYRALIDEAAVRRVVGGESVMAAQVDKVLQAAHDGQAVVQIIPFDSGAYGAADIMFVLLEFTDQPPLVFVEDAVGPDHHVRPDIVQQYRDTIERIRDSALSPRDTMRYLTELRQVYDSARHAQLPGRLNYREDVDVNVFGWCGERSVARR
jgi:transcriptional regulator with XRE-family HTH domain